MRERQRLIIVAKRESRIVLFRAFSVKANKKASEWMMDGKRDGELEPEPGPGLSTSALAGRCHPILRSGSSLSAVNQVESSSPLDKWKAGCKSSPPFPPPPPTFPSRGGKGQSACPASISQIKGSLFRARWDSRSRFLNKELKT